MKITFIAQSGFIFETNSGISFCIDLWLQNPVNPITLDQVPKIDYVFITHDHGDHDMKSGFEIAKRDDAKFISNIDIVKKAVEAGVQKTERSSIGGSVKFDNLEYIQTHAEHTSDTGIPVGFIIKVDGLTIYHMGDTGYFGSFKFFKEAYGIDILLIPIGARYTMGAT